MKILLIDDEKNIRTTLQLKLTDWNHQVVTAASLKDAVIGLSEATYDLVLTDYRLGDSSGSDVIREVLKVQPAALIVVMTAYSSIANAVQVTREGAYDYLQKPFTNDQLRHCIEKVEKLVTLAQENAELRQRVLRPDFFARMASSGMRRLEQFVNQVATTNETVLITGESGTGKSELAKIIHARSKRADHPLVTLYCTTLTEPVLERELFGYIKDAFRGATQDGAGKLEQANGSTLFLDEIGDLSQNAQGKLLRFLQERVIERVGGTSTIPVDTRIIAATNRDLTEEVEAGRFRQDLYYRLNMLQCEVVPLRHRRDDLPILIDRFVQEFSAAHGVERPIVIPRPIMQKLLENSWRGNVRELKNAIDRMLLLSRGREPELSDLPESFFANKTAAASLGLEFRPLDEIEKGHIASVLAVEPNFEKAAKILGITTVTLWRKRKQYGLQ